MEQLGSRWMDFSRNLKYIFRKSVVKTQVSLNLPNKTSTSHEDKYAFFYHISLTSSYSEKCLVKFVEKIETGILSFNNLSRQSGILRDSAEK